MYAIFAVDGYMQCTLCGCVKLYLTTGMLNTIQWNQRLITSKSKFVAADRMSHMASWHASVHVICRAYRDLEIIIKTSPTLLMHCSRTFCSQWHSNWVRTTISAVVCMCVSVSIGSFPQQGPVCSGARLKSARPQAMYTNSRPARQNPYSFRWQNSKLWNEKKKSSWETVCAKDGVVWSVWR